MKKVLSLIALAILISGCFGQKTCERPYILVGDDCCLDEDFDDICDKDKPTTTTSTTTLPTTSTTVYDWTNTGKKEPVTTTTIPQGMNFIPTSGGYIKYISDEYPINFEYPGIWNAQENVLGSVITVWAPRDSSKDLFVENINLYVEDVSMHAGLTVDGYFDTAMKSTKKTLNNFNVLETKNIRVSSIKAVKQVQTYDSNKGRVKQMQVVFIAGGKAYTLTYTATPETFDQYKAEAERTVESIKFR